MKKYETGCQGCIETYHICFDDCRENITINVEDLCFDTVHVNFCRRGEKGDPFIFSDFEPRYVWIGPSNPLSSPSQPTARLLELSDLPTLSGFKLLGNPGSSVSLISEINVANGLVFVGSNLEPLYGDSANTVCEGNDTRVVNALNRTATVQGSLSTSGTVNLDFQEITGTFQTINLTGDINFATSNKAVGRNATLLITVGSTPRTITPPIGWRFFGQSLPVTIANSEILLTLFCFGNSESDVVAAVAERI